MSKAPAEGPRALRSQTPRQQPGTSQNPIDLEGRVNTRRTAQSGARNAGGTSSSRGRAAPKRRSRTPSSRPRGASKGSAAKARSRTPRPTHSEEHGDGPDDGESVRAPSTAEGTQRNEHDGGLTDVGEDDADEGEDHDEGHVATTTMLERDLKAERVASGRGLRAERRSQQRAEVGAAVFVLNRNVRVRRSSTAVSVVLQAAAAAAEPAPESSPRRGKQARKGGKGSTHHSSSPAATGNPRAPTSGSRKRSRSLPRSSPQASCVYPC